MGDEDAPTEYAGLAQADTESAYAWAEEEEPPVVVGRSWRPVVIAVVASVVALVVVGGVAAYHLGKGSAAEPPTQTVEPATPDIEVLDRKFVAALRAEGMPVPSPVGAADRAHKMCEQLQQGWSLNRIIEQLAVEVRPYPDAEVTAEQFARAAVDTYPLCQRG